MDQVTCMRLLARRTSRAFTLLELVLVVGILALLASLSLPALYRELKRETLPESARRMRSLLALVRANAAFDGKRYRIRFPGEDESDGIGGTTQPIIESELDPMHEPEEWTTVTAPWAVGETLLEGVWCAEVRLGRPTVASVRERQEQIAEARDESIEDFVEERPALYIEPDGTSDWATFVVTDAPPDTDLEELEDYPRLEVIIEGPTGLCWIQRAFVDEELDLFEEHNWPIVLRQDFVREQVLTEDDVLELVDIPAEP